MWWSEACGSGLWRCCLGLCRRYGCTGQIQGLPPPWRASSPKAAPERAQLGLPPERHPRTLPAPAAANGQAPCRRRRVGCVIPPDNASEVAAVARAAICEVVRWVPLSDCKVLHRHPVVGGYWERLRCGSVSRRADALAAVLAQAAPNSGVGVDAQPVDSAPRRGSMRGGLQPNTRIRVDSAEVHVAGGVRGTLRSCFEKSRGGARVASIRWTPNQPAGALRLMPSHIGMCVAQPRQGRQPFTQRPDGRRDLAPTRTATHPCRRLGGVWRCPTDMSQRFARRFAPPPKKKSQLHVETCREPGSRLVDEG